MYDFLLITLMVLDEYDEGIPIAWAITNREDQSVLVEFFKSIKSKVGNLSPSSCQTVLTSSIMRGLEYLKRNQ